MKDIQLKVAIDILEQAHIEIKSKDESLQTIRLHTTSLDSSILLRLLPIGLKKVSIWNVNDDSKTNSGFLMLTFND
jgi:hypothetical protein